jgi:hypothetical protein
MAGFQKICSEDFRRFVQDISENFSSRKLRISSTFSFVLMKEAAM